MVGDAEVTDHEHSTQHLHNSQTQKPLSHPVVSALKICISPKRLQSEVPIKKLC